MVQRVKNRDEYTYRCRICGFENLHTKMPQTDLPVTKIGNYGSNATPTPASYSDTMYIATSINFVAASGSVSAKLTDDNLKFGDKHFKSNAPISITTTSGTNDGSYTIADFGVSRGELLLVSTDSLTTENAATAGEVTIKRSIYKPSASTGCPLCESLNSKP